MDRRHMRRLALTPLLALTFSACSGGDDADPAPATAAAAEEPTSAASDDSPEVTADAGPTATDEAPDPIAPVPATGNELFPCSLGDLPVDVFTVAYGQADDLAAVDLGPNADRFRAVMDDYGIRCGGAVDVQAFNLADSAACPDIVALSPELTVTDAASLDVVRCVGAGTVAPLWHEAGMPTGAVPELEGRLISTDLPPDVAARRAVAAARAEGVLAEAVSVLREEDDVAAAIAEAIVAELPGSSVEVINEPACADGAPTGPDEAVVTIVGGQCLAELAVASAATSGPWVVAQHAGALIDEAIVAEGVPDPLDGASAYTVLPFASNGWRFELDPAPRDAACVDYLDGLIGTDTPYPSASWTAATRLCATAHAALQMLTAATSSAPADLMAAVDGVTEVPLPRNLVGAMTAAEPWVAGRDMWVLEWRAGCGCWTQVAGPVDATS